MCRLSVAFTRRKYSSDEPNLMGYNFPSSSAVFRFLEMARVGIRQGRFNGIEERLRREAREEFRNFSSGMDSTTPYFSDELAGMSLGTDTKRKVVLVQGQFEGDDFFKSTIGYDLGTTPYQLYTKRDMPRGQTADEYFTREAVKAYMREHADVLRSKGVDGYRVTHSAFFYFRDADLNLRDLKGDDGSVIMELLLPLVADTMLIRKRKKNVAGYIGVSQVTLPEYERYLAQTLPFESHRIKSTLARKLPRQLLLPNIKEEDVVTDSGAHRVKVASVDEVRELERRIRSGVVGNSAIEIIPKKTRDYYRNPKGNGYRALKLVARVTTKGETFIREIQLVDTPQYFRNEINPNDSAHHMQQERQQELTEEQLSRIPQPILGAIQEIFGKSTIRISLEDTLKTA